MTRLALLVAFAMFTADVAAQQAPRDDSSKVLNSMQGSWSIVTSNGKAPAGVWVLTLTGDSFKITQQDKVVERGTVRVDQAQKPLAIDLSITEGMDAGQIQVGVFEFAGETMTWHVGDPGLRERPRDFTPRDGYQLVVMKRTASQGAEVFAPGNGVSWPTVVYEERPKYTPDALKAKIQGTVHLEIVILPDGTVGEVRVTRSLDKTYGLDEAAIAAAKKWRFKPGLRNGVPVQTKVELILEFRL
jgi:TonB family protein